MLFILFEFIGRNLKYPALENKKIMVKSIYSQSLNLVLILKCGNQIVKVVFRTLSSV